MKAIQITAKSGGVARPLPLPSLHRKGDVPAEFFRRQASGEVPPVDQNLASARFIRAAILRDGPFAGLASDRGALLTFIISGELTLTANGATTTLVSGDVLLIDEQNASRIDAQARDTCRLVQLGVAPDWPGADAQVQPPGTINPREPGKVNIKRVIQKADNLSYYREFPELFAAPPNEWSAPRPVAGYRFMFWEDGEIGWHPEVINAVGIFLSGELESEMSGDNRKEIFRAGDICTAEDRTGVGHYDRCRGAMHVALVIIDTKHLW